jgi:hypothetical protein
VRLAAFVWLARIVWSARDLIGRAVETPHHLAERLDFSLVGGLLALGLLDEFEEFVHRFRSVAQDAERRFDFFERLPDAGRRGRTGRRQRRFRARLATFAMFGWRTAFS